MSIARSANRSKTIEQRIVLNFSMDCIDVSGAEKHIGIKFSHKEFLQEALTHRSYLNEHPERNLEHNERLEFLGDAVLELVITEYLFAHYDSPEGELTLLRSALVNSERLFIVAEKLNIEEYVLMSKGERKDTGKGRQYIMANLVEAIIGAIYLDKGYKTAEKFIHRYFIPLLPDIVEHVLYKDPKTLLQETVQEEVGVTPHYVLLKEWGPDHDKQFTTAVMAGEQKLAEGTGSSKQEAEKQAAAQALAAHSWKHN